MAGLTRAVRIVVVSDIHYASPAEQCRTNYEQRTTPNPILRRATWFYRHHIWLRDPFGHNALLDRFCDAAGSPDLVVANGDYSCDSAFVGVSDAAAFESARLCLGRLRDRFGATLNATIGDHELGKQSLFGGFGGLRLKSWERATTDLGLPGHWSRRAGAFTLLGLTSTLLGFPVLEPEALPEERAGWWRLRAAHLEAARELFRGLTDTDRVVLFVHDPTALPFLAQEPAVTRRLGQIEATVIGHLHSRAILRLSHRLAGMPTIRFLGVTVRRLSQALQRARAWRPFNVHLCPSLAGIELFKDGGYLEIEDRGRARAGLDIRFRPLARES